MRLVLTKRGHQVLRGRAANHDCLWTDNGSKRNDDVSCVFLRFKTKLDYDLIAKVLLDFVHYSKRKKSQIIIMQDASFDRAFGPDHSSPDIVTFMTHSSFIAPHQPCLSHTTSIPSSTLCRHRTIWLKGSSKNTMTSSPVLIFAFHGGLGELVIGT